MRRLFFLLTLPLSIAAHAERPIENFVSPPQLFPEEGTPRAPYVPLPAYDRPGGKVIGQVTANLTPCAPLKENEECDIAPSWHLERRDGTRVELAHDMVGYEQEALLSYQPARIENGKAWAYIEADGGGFWTNTLVQEVINYEARATWVLDFDSWCSQPGKCAPLSAAMRKELDRMLAGEYNLEHLSSETYAIEGIIQQGGKRYYKVKQVDTQAGSVQPQLPKIGWIPTRRRDGTHTGVFYPKGC
ncbi:hypothetical protein GTP46_20050 [Duganella sp. FT135W]|uniref:Uncharacterized protein n=1 Tax=Duganella flavida TaxID=2692175 RepID=A0A6L8KFC2_9BURK|nr:hypothetical protein [Duganella flavida]MYM24928.1 hypothetical protein [Duganella flavida]